MTSKQIIKRKMRGHRSSLFLKQKTDDLASKIIKLRAIVKNRVSNPEDRDGIVMYLAVCFLGMSIDDVARYFSTKYNKVRHWVTLYGVQLKQQKTRNLMHSIAKKYSKKYQTELQFNA